MVMVLVRVHVRRTWSTVRVVDLKRKRASQSQPEPLTASTAPPSLWLRLALALGRARASHSIVSNANCIYCTNDTKTSNRRVQVTRALAAQTSSKHSNTKYLLEDALVEELLELLVAVIDAQLLEAVLLEVFYKRRAARVAQASKLTYAYVYCKFIVRVCASEMMMISERRNVATRGGMRLAQRRDAGTQT